jgi:hypothetical protein
MFRIENERDIEGLGLQWVDFSTLVIEFEEIDGNCIIFMGLGFNSESTLREMIPIKQCGSKHTDHPQCDLDLVIVLGLGLENTHH